MEKPKLDFCLIGAQKAGTSTLAALLDQVNGICLSRPKEPMLLCADDYLVHQQESFHPEARWTDFVWEKPETWAANYAKCFAHQQAGDLLGDASTTYAPSAVAAKRLHELNPEAKILFVLRNPLKRTESAYWHGVRKGLTTGSLENELRFGRGGMVSFGFYEEQLRRYHALFGKQRVKVFHFEELIVEPLKILAEALDFLGVQADLDALKVEAENESYYPKWPLLHRLLRRSLRLLGKEPSVATLQFAQGEKLSESGSGGAYKKYFMQGQKPHGLKPATEARLKEIFRRENAGLSELLGENVFARWGWEQQAGASSTS